MKRLLIASLLAAALTLRSTALDISTATIAELQAAMKSGTLTAEKLTATYLARIAAYDQEGPALNTIITANPKALAEAKALDAERKAGKVRGPLHGIPIVLKDNVDTFDLPTTGGSQLLAGSIAPDDAFIAKKLRDAGAIVLAKVNLSEWAGGGGSVSGAKDPEIIKKGAVPNGSSSMGGQTKNPHDPLRGPAGSSGGTGSAIAAAFAQFGIGTDTGGSVRGPSAANGIVGLKPTLGLLSRDGIIPLALTFDTGGPMARNVTDLAISLGAMTGVDPADAATQASAGKFETDYTKFLKKGSLKGARIGVARDFTGKDPGTDEVFNAAVATLTKLGATVVDVKFPEHILLAKQPLSSMIMAAEFKAQVTDYLKTTKPGFPKSFAEIVALSNDPKTKYRAPEKAFGLEYQSKHALDLDDPLYLAAKNQGLAMIKATISALFAKHKLDAIVYPTSPRPATLIKPPAPIPTGGADSPTSFANQTGFPDLIVPAGMTKDGLPVTISFFGTAFTEGKLISYGYDFEQATKARVLPKTTPLLPADTFSLGLTSQ
jgi:amidase